MRINLMRQLYILLLISTGYLGAQNPDLPDRDWYLQEVEIDGTSYLRPIPNFQAIALFSAVDMVIDHPSCEEGFGSGIVYTNQDVFNIDDTSVSIFGTCVDPNILLFMEKHYSLYLLNNTSAQNPFIYEITTGSNGLTLTVTNGNGDIGVYGDQLLSTETFEKSSLHIFPVPTENITYIKNPESLPIKEIVVYNMLRQKVLYKTDDFSQLDLTYLPTGQFLVYIVTEDEIIIKKISKS